MAMQTIFDIFNLLYSNTNKYVFKKYDKYVIMMSKLDDTITNEDRLYFVVNDRTGNLQKTGIYRKETALFRGNKFFVEKIIDVYTLEEVDEVEPVFLPRYLDAKQAEDAELKYVVGSIVEDKEYDTTINDVYSKGIHYF